LVLTNQVLRLEDASGALPSRFVTLQLTNSWLGREDTGLADRLLGEMPGILLWAVEGWRQLQADGWRLTQPEAGRAAAEEMERLASPVLEFVGECCDVGPEFQVPRHVLYAAWERWCGDNHQAPRGSNIFGRDLKAALARHPALAPAGLADRQLDRVRHYV